MAVIPDFQHRLVHARTSSTEDSVASAVSTISERLSRGVVTSTACSIVQRLAAKDLMLHDDQPGIKTFEAQQARTDCKA